MCFQRCAVPDCPTQCLDGQYRDDDGVCQDCKLPEHCTGAYCTSGLESFCHICEADYRLDDLSLGCVPILDEQICDLCPSATSKLCADGYTCCGCGDGQGACVPLGECLIKCMITCPEPPSCDMCLDQRHQVCLGGMSCCGCTGKGTCSRECGIRCMSQPVCRSDASTSSEIVTKHNVNINCDDPEVDDFVKAVETKAKISVGEWPGTIVGILKDCKNTGQKRTPSSEIETQLTFRGPYAETTSAAVASGLEDGPVEAGAGVSGEFLESISTTSEDDSGLSGGAIAGIVIGSVVGAALAVVALVLVTRVAARHVEDA